MKINLHEPVFDNLDFDNLKKCFASGWVSSGGKFVTKFENLLKKKISTQNLTSIINCTSALQISIKLAGIKFDDEVIVPTVTFVSTVNAILYNNANPIFMDIDKFFNLDHEKTIDFIRNHTFYKNGNTYNLKSKKKISALIIVHTFGNAANIDDLVKLCRRRNIKIIEDAAESLGTKYIKGPLKSKFTSTIGNFGCLSFNGNKIITSGGGGAIVGKDKNAILRARHLINQAKIDEINFIHDDVGYNMRLSNLHASIGYSQLKKLDNYIFLKKKIHKKYLKLIKNIKGLSLLEKPDYCNSNYWLNVLEIDPKLYKLSKKKLIKKFIDNEIFVRSVWLPNHLQKPFKKYQSYKITNAYEKVKNSICLPSSVNVSDKLINKIFDILDV